MCGSVPAGTNLCSYWFGLCNGRFVLFKARTRSRDIRFPLSTLTPTGVRHRHCGGMSKSATDRVANSCLSNNTVHFHQIHYGDKDNPYYVAPLG